MKKSLGTKIVGLIVLIVTAPIAVLFGLAAARYLMQQFLNGWIPSRWLSNSSADWIFGDGTEGAASNYFGFMFCAVPSGLAGKAALWGYAKLTSPTNSETANS
jgi:hypothetical protein